MSLGNNIDDSDSERRAILQEAAVQKEVNGLAEDEAIKVAEQLLARRAEAEKSEQVALDEQGNATSYHDADLNQAPVPAAQRETVNLTYQKLCENEGIEPI
jgi:hypothetical protein